MRHVTASLLALLVAVGTPIAADAASASVPAQASEAGGAAGTTPDWQGSRQAMPDLYSWLDDITPSDCYTIVVVRGIGPRAALTRLGGVIKQLADRTPHQAENYLYNHMRADFSGPNVVQVTRLGHAVVVYAPLGVLDDAALAKLSRGKVAAEFFTDVDADTYVTVAKHGRVVRAFDAMFKPPKKGALAAEAGLDWGRRHENTFATAWAFNERLTVTHLSQEWFEGLHPTYVVGDGALL